MEQSVKTVKNDRLIKNSFFFLLFLVLLGFSFILSLALGAEKIPFAAVLGKGDRFQNIILWRIRLPRSLLVILTGILLGGSGAVFQLFFRNPLAEPGIMGISSGATLGAVIATAIISTVSVTGTSNIIQTAGGTYSAALAQLAQNQSPSIGSLLAKFISPVNLSAFLGALLSGLLVTLLAFSKGGRSNSIMLLLCGTALGTLYSSISSTILITNSKELHAVYTWIMGSFNGRGWNELLFILLPSAVSIIIMFCISNQLDLLSCGEKSALSLGIEVNRLRIWVLICGSLAISAAVCAGGTIGFVGLIAPHIVRKLTGPKSRTLIPFSMLFGAILLLLSDTIARIVIIPAELPAGIITSILGVPFFLSLCFTKTNN